MNLNLDQAKTEQPPKTSVIRLRNVNKIFQVKSQNIWVLKDINLEIGSGEFVIIFGPSGSGKSTMLHIMLGLEKPTAGESYLFDTPINNVTETQMCLLRKRSVGIVYQQPNWIKSLPVIDNVGFPLSLKGVNKEQARLAATAKLAVVGMAQWSNYRPTELSSGQQQRVALARALVAEPDLIVADEPTGNLDVVNGDRLMDLFKAQQEAGKTIIMVTHNVDYLKYATKIVQFRDGFVLNVIDPRGKDIKLLQKELTSDPDPKLFPDQEKYSPAALERFVQTYASELNLEQPKVKKGFTKIVRIISRRIVRLPQNIIKAAAIYVSKTFVIMAVLSSILFYKVVNILTYIPLVNRLFTKKSSEKLEMRVHGFVAGLRKSYKDRISLIDIADIAMHNMFNKRARSWITIGGVSIGIAFIVFLLSIGYGIQELVVSRIATLDELKQLEARPAVSTNISITDETVSKFKEFEGVNEVQPVLNIAGQISFSNSQTDAVIFGAQSDYLKATGIDISNGELFNNNDIVSTLITKESQEDITLASADNPNNLVVETPNSNESGKNMLELPQKERVAVINTQLATLLGQEADQIIGKEVEVSFIFTGDLTTSGQRMESIAVPYEVIGVTQDGDTPQMYVPLIDLKETGVTKYSLLNVIMSNSNAVEDVRRRIEFSGYQTTSVLDTVLQVESLFSSVRLALGIVGGIALSVAALGMFNTLSVSLLERTREVGLMKAIGMVPKEVQDLFITEAIAMGFIGGFGGLFVGFILGKIISLFLSAIAISRGFGVIDVTFIPPSLALSIMLLAAFVGTLTGYPPANRATRISAINALRYE